MDRKILIPLIAAFAFVVIVIGAGAAAIAVQVRKNAPPTFTEVERFLRQPPASTGWSYLSHKAGRPSSIRVRGWLSKFGIQRREEFQEVTYTLSHNASTGRGEVIVGKSGDKVVIVQFTGSFDEQEKDLENTFFHQFPKLRGRHVPGKPRP
jgi:hypothetical protein